MHCRTRTLLCAATAAPLRVAVVGSGPSGFYTAQSILKGDSTAEVDIYEKLPIPFGLARYGVAPDHPEVKNVGLTFTDMVEGWAEGRVRFHGNVEIGRGKSVDVATLLQHYHQVVVATGADQDRKVGIPGEEAHTVSARRLVAWYNGLPGAEFPRDLSATRSVAVVGNGNVALDCARILLAPESLLGPTDITTPALRALAASGVRRVDVVARRGILNTAFTIKEFREMLHLGVPDAKGGPVPNGYLSTLVHNADDVGVETDDLGRKYKRLVGLIEQARDAPKPAADRVFNVRYLRRPVEATAEGLVTEVMRVEGNPLDGRVAGTGVFETVEADLILTSVGYRSVLDDPAVPFDTSRGVVPAEAATGRVVDPASEQTIPRLYCSGWVKNGPVGVILSAHLDGKAVGGAVLKDAPEARQDAACTGLGHAGIVPHLAEDRPYYSTWKTWQSIREHEESEGAKLGKAAEKLISVDDMLRFV